MSKGVGGLFILLCKKLLESPKWTLLQVPFYSQTRSKEDTNVSFSSHNGKKSKLNSNFRVFQVTITWQQVSTIEGW